MKPAEPVATPLGALRGIHCEDHPQVRAFLGIPYAEPPTGLLRFAAPEPKKPWIGVREAAWYGPNCAQVVLEPGSFYQKEFYPTVRPMSEDGLFLNVWSAAEAGERLPVLVWIHGGAFVEGAGSAPQFVGEELALRGVVVVTINYRLGALGFLAHPELTAEAGQSGNYGLLDQLEALRWVRDNIACFGGDPDRVTIDGQSAGGMSVYALVASPLARGLFRGAIAQSCGPIRRPLPSLAEAEEQGREFLHLAGCRTIAELRMRPWDEIVELGGKMPGPGLPFRPIVDGRFLPEPIEDIVRRGGQNPVDLLAGCCGGEGAMFGGGSLLESMREAALGQRALGRRGYLYCFDRRLPDPEKGEVPAFHSAELMYQFGTLGSSWRPWQDADREISDRMMRHWAAFCAAGDPNGPGLPRWEPVASGDGRCMRLGTEAGMGTVDFDPDRP